VAVFGFVQDEVQQFDEAVVEDAQEHAALEVIADFVQEIDLLRVVGSELEGSQQVVVFGAQLLVGSVKKVEFTREVVNAEDF
jgi:hypothetical protein